MAHTYITHRRESIHPTPGFKSRSFLYFTFSATGTCKKKVFPFSFHRESAKLRNQDDIDKEELGGKLFEKVEESHPEIADKITGMLLEMSVEEIERLLENPQELQENIQLAENALSASGV